MHISHRLRSLSDRRSRSLVSQGGVRHTNLHPGTGPVWYTLLLSFFPSFSSYPRLLVSSSFSFSFCFPNLKLGFNSIQSRLFTPSHSHTHTHSPTHTHLSRKASDTNSRACVCVCVCVCLCLDGLSQINQIISSWQGEHKHRTAWQYIHSMASYIHLRFDLMLCTHRSSPLLSLPPPRPLLLDCAGLVGRKKRILVVND
jgi:hypothetical protein